MTDTVVQVEEAHAPPPTPCLEVSGVSVSFGGIRALENVSLAIGHGEIVGLIGPNGAGKTTLFDVICGVRVPDAGRVLMEGNDVTTSRPMHRARGGLHRTYQAVQVFGWLSVIDNVVAALDWQGGGGGLFADLAALPTRKRRERQRRAQAMAALERCGLGAVADDPSSSLPIGLARMLELARATVQAPRALLLDEPTSGLDGTEAARLSQQVKDICRTANCGVLLVEHDMEFVMGICDRIVVLNLGQVIAAGTPEEVRLNEAVRVAYLGAN